MGRPELRKGPPDHGISVATCHGTAEGGAGDHGPTRLSPVPQRAPSAFPPARALLSWRVVSGRPSESDILVVLKEAAGAIAEALGSLEDWGPTGKKKGQYRCDLVADQAALPLILGAGMGVVSEESGGHATDRPIVVVMDPVDGSTNASQGLPWWATSMCAVDAEGPCVAVVVNQANGKTYEAVRGEGASADGVIVKPSPVAELSAAIVGFCGVPRRYLGWNQARVLGSASLDMCAVAEGVLDAYADATGGSLAPWDYLGALLVCTEAGAVVADAGGEDLVVVEHAARRAPVAAATPELLAELIAALRP